MDTPDNPDTLGKPSGGWRLRFHEVIFEADTRAGQRFDQILIGVILLSVAVVVIDSVQPMQNRYGPMFGALEWGFTLLFTAEYVLRLLCVQKPMKYAVSFFGVIDLLSLLPTYLALLMPDAYYLIDVRILRLLRVFRVFKLTGYVAEYTQLGQALVASRRKIMVFLSFVLMVVLIMGTLMYVVEGPEHGFTNIPTAMYWAVTTMTTVGFGDITPQTGLGRLISSMMMLLGWGVLAVPTGIVTAEMTVQRQQQQQPALVPSTAPAAPDQSATHDTPACPKCHAGGHVRWARFCFHCGSSLPASGIPR